MIPGSSGERMLALSFRHRVILLHWSPFRPLHVKYHLLWNFRMLYVREENRSLILLVEIHVHRTGIITFFRETLIFLTSTLDELSQCTVTGIDWPGTKPDDGTDIVARNLPHGHMQKQQKLLSIVFLIGLCEKISKKKKYFWRSGKE